MPSEAERYVVVHTLVDDWPQGSVIGRDDFHIRDAKGESVHDRFDRLLAAGAVRPATGVEGELARVEVLPFGVAMSPEAQALLATKDAEIDQLTRALAAARDKAAFHQRQGTLAASAPPEQDPTLAPILEEKDARIAVLREQLKATHETVAEAQGQLTARDEAAAEASSEAREGREFPPQSTGYDEGNPAVMPEAAAEEPHRRRRKAKEEGEG